MDLCAAIVFGENNGKIVRRKISFKARSRRRIISVCLDENQVENFQPARRKSNLSESSERKECKVSNKSKQDYRGLNPRIEASFQHHFMNFEGI